MTDTLRRRLEHLEDRVSRHERDLARAVRILTLRNTGHATKDEIDELTAIADHYPRSPAPPAQPD